MLFRTKYECVCKNPECQELNIKKEIIGSVSKDYLVFDNAYCKRCYRRLAIQLHIDDRKR